MCHNRMNYFNVSKLKRTESSAQQNTNYWLNTASLWHTQKSFLNSIHYCLYRTQQSDCIGYAHLSEVGHISYNFLSQHINIFNWMLF